MIDWIFNSFVAWFLETITGVFDNVTEGFFSFFQLNINQFFIVFSPLQGLYTTFIKVGYGLILLIVTFRLLRNLIANITNDYEPPFQIACRTIIAIILVANAASIVNFEFELSSNTYYLIATAFNSSEDTSDWSNVADAIESSKETSDEAVVSDKKESKGKKITNKNKKGKVEEVVKDTTKNVCSEVVIKLMTVGLIVAIFFNFFKMLLEAAERYVVICLAFLFSPLIFATVATKETSKATMTFIKVVFNELLLFAFNIIFVKGTIAALRAFTTSGSNSYLGAVTVTQMGNTGPTSYTIGNVFTFCILILAFLIAGQKMDQYMRQLGLDVVQTGSLLDEIRGGIRGAITGAGMAMKGASIIKRIGGKMNGVASAGNAIIRDANSSSTSAKLDNLNSRSNQLGNPNNNRAKAKAAMNNLRNTKGMTHEQLKNALNTATGGLINQKFPNAEFKPSADGKGIEAMVDGKRVTFKSGTSIPPGRNFQMLTNANGERAMLADRNGNPLGAIWASSGDKTFGNNEIDALRAGQSDKLFKSLDQASGTVSGLIGRGNQEAIASMIKNNTGMNVDANDLFATKLGDNSMLVTNGKNGTPLMRMYSDTGSNSMPLGASILENGFGGEIGVLPASNMSILDNCSANLNDPMAYINAGGNNYLAHDILGSADYKQIVNDNNISETVTPSSFEMDNDGNFTAKYFDGLGSYKDVSGTIDLSGEKIISLNENEITNDYKEFTGLGNFFDASSYYEATGMAPVSATYDKEHNCIAVEREDGKTDYLQDAVVAPKGRYEIRGGDNQSCSFRTIEKTWSTKR